jgi:peptide-methionine (S)-S-oxide reductase
MSGSRWLQAWLLALLLSAHAPLWAQQAVALPTPATDQPKSEGTARSVVLAGGCFWGVQGLFEHVKGVRRVVAGYTGGAAEHANYPWVSSGLTAHAEAVQITYDPAAISLGEILQIFFSVAHDPTQLDQQWPDVGPQYRSAIFYADSTQQELASAYITQLTAAAAFRRPIVTRLEPLGTFYPAEAHHQDYLLKYPRAAYIVMHDLPKLRELQHLWPTRYRERAVDIDGNERTLAQ